ncbi:MAG: 4Fe-4S binding protein [Coriobacteriales bacterium]|jgi:formate hydrogenlyase subunit 6/NADH:ubiquinone oxidoreductase subunit I|nr:4Fe-4S binding protein [Coriobacteriales bacterium]
MPDIASVSTVIEVLEKLESFDIRVHPQRCVCVRNRHARCSRCSDACTSGAISLKDELSIDPDLCVGCGTCATVCPTCALETIHPNDAELLQRAKPIIKATDGQLAFLCHTARESATLPLDGEQLIELTCLSRLEESLLTSLFAFGAEDILLIKGDCESCPRRQGVETIELVLETMQALTAAWNLTQTLDLTTEIPPKLFLAPRASEARQVSDGVSRREFFTLIKENTKEVAAATAQVTLDHYAAVKHEDETAHVPVHVMRDGTLPHFVPSRRERLLDQLEYLGSPVVDTINIRLWGHIILDGERCSSCRMCATFCPTGAICKFDDPDGTFGIEHYMADCVHCRLCEDVCREHAIVCSTKVPIKKLVEGEIERYEMKPLEWLPNKADSIFRKMQTVIPNANMHERC